MKDQILTTEAAQKLFPGESILKIHSVLGGDGYEILSDGTGWIRSKSGPYKLAPADAEAIGRSALGARYLATWFQSGNEEQRLKALRQACSSALSNGHDLDDDARGRIARVAAEINSRIQ